MFSCLCTNPAYASGFAFSAPAGFVPTAVALNYGVYEVKKSGKKDLTTALMEDNLPGKGTEAFPPSFVMTCEGDFVADQAAAAGDNDGFVFYPKHSFNTS